MESQNHNDQQEERRGMRHELMRELQLHIDSDLATHTKMMEHMSEVKTEIATLSRTIHENNMKQEFIMEKIMSAFPDNDPMLHRRTHDISNAINAEKEVVGREIKTKLLAGLSWGILIIIIYAMWEYIKLSIISGRLPPQ